MTSFISGGLVLTQVMRNPLTMDPTPMCDWAVRIGEAVATEMPR